MKKIYSNIEYRLTIGEARADRLIRVETQADENTVIRYFLPINIKRYFKIVEKNEFELSNAVNLHNTCQHPIK